MPWNAMIKTDWRAPAATGTSPGARGLFIGIVAAIGMILVRFRVRALFLTGIVNWLMVLVCQSVPGSFEKVFALVRII